jgi:hypothetical protein
VSVAHVLPGTEVGDLRSTFPLGTRQHRATLPQPPCEMRAEIIEHALEKKEKIGRTEGQSSPSQRAIAQSNTAANRKDS